MPRTLPWSVGSNNRRKSSPASLTVKKQSASRSATATESDEASTPARASRPKVRSSSASPPREPPPPEEYMRDGLEHDDIYVMVEDEFLATAQTFTRHLHQAEYQRRKQQAKIENAAAIKKFSRPTDRKTTLRADTAKNIESERARGRHNSAIDELRAEAGRPAVDSELEEVDSDEEDKEDDPWVGTSLHALMTSPSKSRSLVGLQKITSTTRAALGFSKAVGLPPRGGGVSAGRGYEERGSGSNLDTGRVSEEPDDVLTVTKDDDDLDAPFTRPERTPRQSTSTAHRSNPERSAEQVTRTPVKQEIANKSPLHRREQPVKTEPRSNSPDRQTRVACPRPPAQQSYKSRMTRFFDDLEEPQATRESNISVQRPVKVESREDVTRKRPLSETVSIRNENGEEKPRKSRLNEVPMFLM